MRARVYRSAQRIFHCKIEGQAELVMATAKGNLLKGSDSVVVGDLVEIKGRRAVLYF